MNARATDTLDSGFTLVEVLIALVLSSMLLTALVSIIPALAGARERASSEKLIQRDLLQVALLFDRKVGRQNNSNRFAVIAAHSKSFVFRSDETSLKVSIQNAEEGTKLYVDDVSYELVNSPAVFEYLLPDGGDGPARWMQTISDETASAVRITFKNGEQIRTLLLWDSLLAPLSREP